MEAARRGRLREEPRPEERDKRQSARLLAPRREDERAKRRERRPVRLRRVAELQAAAAPQRPQRRSRFS